MPEGSTEVPATPAETELLQAAEAYFASEEQGEETGRDGDQAAATDGATTDPVDPESKPETVAGEPAPEPELAPTDQVDTSHWPQQMRELASGLTPDAIAAMDATYKSIQADQTKKTQAASEFEKVNKQMIAQGQMLDRLLSHPQAEELVMQAARLASGNVHPDEPEQEIPDLMEMENADLVAEIDRRAELRADARVRAALEEFKTEQAAPQLRRKAIISAGLPVADDFADLDGAAKSAAWDDMVNGVGDGNITTENVSEHFRTYLTMAQLKAKVEAFESVGTSKSASKRSAKAASLPTTASAVPTQPVPVWKREGRAPTVEELGQAALHDEGLAGGDLMRVIQGR